MSVALLGRQFLTDEGESLFIADIQVRIDAGMEGAVTRHPVEDGGAISDHVICEPERISLEMEVSNNPVCGVDPSDPDIGFAGTNNRVANAYQRLKQIKKNKRIFNVLTKLGIHRNMVIESFDTSQDSRTSEVLRFRANLVSVDIVSSESIEIQTNTADEGLRGPVTRGDVSPEPVAICGDFVDGFQTGFVGLLQSGVADYCDCDDIEDFVQREACLRSIGVDTDGVISAGDL